MPHKCDACCQTFTRSNALTRHCDTPKHLANQAIYDGNQLSVFAQKEAEWDKRRAQLLKETKETQEQLIDVMNISTKLRDELERYKLAIARYEMLESNDKKSSAIFKHQEDLKETKIAELERINKAQAREIKTLKLELEDATSVIDTLSATINEKE